MVKYASEVVEVMVFPPYLDFQFDQDKATIHRQLGERIVHQKAKETRLS